MFVWTQKLVQQHQASSKLSRIRRASQFSVSPDDFAQWLRGLGGFEGICHVFSLKHNRSTLSSAFPLDFFILFCQRMLVPL